MFSKRYHSETNEVVSVITVHVVKTVQFFRCDLRSSIDQHICFSSRLAQLRVEYFPRKKDLSCGPQNPEPFGEGDVLDIFCKVIRSNPAVDMRWKLFPDATILPFPPNRDTTVYRVLSHKLSITKDLHLKKLVCEVTSEIAFPVRLLQCFVGPIKVYHAPKVIVHPSNAEVLHNYPIKLLCVVNGYPDQFTFIWSCLPIGIFVGCASVSETAEISTSVHVVVPEEGLEAEIICTVSNSIGQAIGSSHVNVLPVTMSSSVPFLHVLEQTAIPLIPHQDNITLSIILQTPNETTIYDTSLTVSCSLENTLLHDRVNIQWYFGGNKKIKLKENFNCKINRTSPFRSDITFFNVRERDIESEIYCLVVLANFTYKSSLVNLTQNVMNMQPFPNPHHALTVSWNKNTNAISQPTVGDQLSSTSRPGHVVTFAILGALAAVVIISCIVALLSYAIWKHFKMANSNHTPEQEVDTRQPDSTRSLDSDPVYHTPKWESDSKLRDITSSSYATQLYPICNNRDSDSSDNYLSYVGTSNSCSLTSSHGSSDVYSELDGDNIPTN